MLLELPGLLLTSYLSYLGLFVTQEPALPWLHTAYGERLEGGTLIGATIKRISNIV
jgi:hypothetical protein